MTFFVLLNLVIYMPFHLFEEGIGDFPKWMYEHKWLPYHMTHGHWMANNIFLYYPMLLAAVFLFLANRVFVCFGAGILIWGVINFGDHFFYTLRDKRVSPGLFTGIIFLINSVLGLKNFMFSSAFSGIQFIGGILIGGVLFGLPIGLCVVFYQFFERYFSKQGGNVRV